MARSRLTPEEDAEQDLQRWRQQRGLPLSFGTENHRPALPLGWPLSVDPEQPEGTPGFRTGERSPAAQGSGNEPRYALGIPGTEREIGVNPAYRTGGTFRPERGGVQLTAYQPAGANASPPIEARPPARKLTPAPGQKPAPGDAGGGTRRPTATPAVPTGRRSGTPATPATPAGRRSGTPAAPEATLPPVPRGRVDGSDGTLVQDYFKRDIHRARTKPELARDYAFGVLKGPKAVESEDALAKEVTDRAQARDLPLPALYANEQERREAKAVYPLMDRYDHERIGPKFLKLYEPPTDAFAEAAGGRPIPAFSNGYNTPARKAEALVMAAHDWIYFPEWARKQGIKLTRAQLDTFRHAAAARTLETLRREKLDDEIMGNLVMLYVTNALGGAVGKGLGTATPWLATKVPWIARALAGLNSTAMKQAPTLTRWAKQASQFLDAPGAVRSGTADAIVGAGVQQLEDPEADLDRRLKTFGQNLIGGAAGHSGLHATGRVGKAVSGKARGTVTDVKAAIRRRAGSAAAPEPPPSPEPIPPPKGMSADPQSTAPEPQPGAVAVSGKQPFSAAAREHLAQARKDSYARIAARKSRKTPPRMPRPRKGMRSGAVIGPDAWAAELGDLFDYAFIGATHLADGVLNRKEWNLRMMAKAGKEAEAHLDRIWELAQRIHEGWQQKKIPTEGDQVRGSARTYLLKLEAGSPRASNPAGVGADPPPPAPGATVPDPADPLGKTPASPSQGTVPSKTEGVTSPATPAKTSGVNPVTKGTYRLGKRIDGGGEKEVYLVDGRDDLVIGMAKDQVERVKLEAEAERLLQLKRLGIPAVEPLGVIEIDGRPGLLMPRYEIGSKKIARQVKGSKAIEIVGTSKYLNARSIKDLEQIRSLLIKLKISIADIQFLIGRDGQVVINDPMSITTNKAPSDQNKKMINKLIQAAQENIR